jgi:hypothetical protein
VWRCLRDHLKQSLRYLAQFIEQYIRLYANYNQGTWVDLLYKLEFTYNNSEHASTRMTSFYANFGYHPSGPSAPVEPLPNSVAKSHLENLSDFRAQLIDIRKVQADYSENYDRKVKCPRHLDDQPLYATSGSMPKITLPRDLLLSWTTGSYSHSGLPKGYSTSYTA